jgi:hypothetical protein
MIGGREEEMNLQISVGIEGLHAAQHGDQVIVVTILLLEYHKLQSCKSC